MADTVITNTPGVTRSADEGTTAVGWVVAGLVVLALIVAGFVLYQNGTFSGVGAGTDINVTVPAGTGTGGAAQ